ncbi:hypothetical protein RhiirA1_455069 [Rhizophagus irregularis]|uniref:Uncharacterized protein n=1 Tax=Rhizophagus irregularis TaxID=588596 RepID=A0A2N0S3T0_9GLOM|nr:hypothetical protein RhiirA1_455069 [Rhizophagus irregularis]
MFAENKRSTEPFSFFILKKICSFLFIIALIFYIYNQFSQFSESISKPNLIISKFNFDLSKINITIGICGSNVNCSYKYSESNEYENCTVTNEVPIEYFLNSPGCYRYSFRYNHIRTEIAILSPNITSAYLDGLEIDKYYPPELNPIHYLKEQTTVIYYSPTIIKRISNRYAYGLADVEGKEYVNFNIHTDTSDLKIPNETTLILRPTSQDIYYQEETYNILGSTISNIGGFFSSLSGISVFLFGASKLAPWGFLQTRVFNCLCTRYRRKLIRKLKSKYEPIPFVSGRTKNYTLEERVQSIENLLEEYYLDTDFLNLLLEDNKDNKVDDKV